MLKGGGENGKVNNSRVYGSYQRAFVVAMILCVVGFVLTFVYKAIHKKLAK